MANEAILDLPQVFSLNGTEQIPLVKTLSGTQTTVRTSSQVVANTFANNLPCSIEYVLNDGGTVLSTGMKGYLQLPFTGQFTAAALFGSGTGSISIDLWLCSYAAFDGGATAPTAANSICGGNYPTITSSSKYQDTSLTGWTTSFTTNDVIAFNVRSNVSFTQMTISLKATRNLTT